MAPGAEQPLLIQLDDEKGGDTSRWGGAPGLERARCCSTSRARATLMVATMASITAATTGAAAGN